MFEKWGIWREKEERIISKDIFFSHFEILPLFNNFLSLSLSLFLLSCPSASLFFPLPSCSRHMPTQTHMHGHDLNIHNIVKQRAAARASVNPITDDITLFRVTLWVNWPIRHLMLWLKELSDVCVCVCVCMRVCV